MAPLEPKYPLASATPEEFDRLRLARDVAAQLEQYRYARCARCGSRDLDCQELMFYIAWTCEECGQYGDNY